jgi:heme oxygenase (mycobilin-producing)
VSFVVINAITVPKESRSGFEDRFARRAGEVSKSPGFETFELLRPVGDEAGDKYLVYTRWDSRESFEAWVKSPAFTHGHRSSSEGGPVGTASEVWTYDVIQHEDAPPTG